METKDLKSGHSSENTGKYSGQFVLVMLLALAVFGIHLAADLLYDQELDLYQLIIGVCGCLMILLFYLSWRVYKNKNRYLGTAVFLGIAAVIVSLGAAYQDYIFEGIFLFFVMTFPVILVLMLDAFLPQGRKYMPKTRLLEMLGMTIIGAVLFLMHTWAGWDAVEGLTLLLPWMEGLVLLLGLYKEEDAQRQRELKWRMWIVSLGVFFFVSSFTWGYTTLLMHLNVWNQAVTSCLPLLYPFLLKKIRETTEKAGKFSVARTGVLYFAAVLILVWVCVGIPGVESSLWRYNGDLALYYLLMADIVFSVEMRGVLKKKNGRKGKAGAGVFAVAGAANLLAAAIVFAANRRIREIFYQVISGGQGAGAGEDTDWIAYRINALKSFFAGNLDRMTELFPGHDGREGYQVLEDGRGLGSLIYRNGYWFLAAVIVLILGIVLLLFRWKRKEGGALRCVRYLAVSYLIRMIMILVLTMFMFVSYGLDLPFTVLTMMDIMILALYLYEMERPQKKTPR